MNKTWILVGCCVLGSLASAEDWLTFGGDPQRDGWARSETVLSPETVKGMKLEWKLQLDNTAKEENSLTAPVVVEQLVTPRGFKDAVMVAGASDTLYSIDVDTGKLFWKRQFESEKRAGQGFLCPAALNATPVIDKRFGAWTVYAIASDGKLHSVNAVNGEERTPPLPFVPPFSKSWSLNLVNGSLYTTLSQNCFLSKSGVYAMDLTHAEHSVKSFQAAEAGAGIWGRAGAAISPANIVYVATGDGPYDEKKGDLSDSILAVSADDLKLVDYYTPPNQAYLNHKDLDMGCASPVAFSYKQRELLVSGGKEGVLYLLDAKSLGGPGHHTALFRSPRYANDEANLAGHGFWGAFASWQDPKGDRWIYAPAWGPQASNSPAFPALDGPTADGSIMAFRVADREGNPVLDPVWRSRNLQVPEPPIVANGVVYALSNGENVQSIHESGRLLTSAERIATHPGNATLFAFDAATGKMLYSSGKQVSVFAHMSGLALGNGHVYLTTFDNVVYSFGLGSQ